MRIAVIGCGEVGLVYARALLSKGRQLLLCDTRPGKAAQAFAADNRVPLHTGSGSWLGEADIVISCVVGSVSLEAARSAFSHMARGAQFIDMTTCDPEHIRIAAVEAQSAGLSYADVAIMGAMAINAARTNLLIAGTGAAAAAELFGSIGASVALVEGGAAGDAAALKILRSVFTKGLEALAVETFIAAERHGLTDRLYDALDDIDRAPLRQTLEALIRTHVVHAPRRLKEVEEAQRQLESAGLNADVTLGVRQRFARTAEKISSDPFEDGVPVIGEALAWLQRT